MKNFVRSLLLTICFVGCAASVTAQRAVGTQIPLETALFNGDTVVLHGAPAAAALSRELAQFITTSRPLPGLQRATAGRAIRIYLADNEAAFRALTGGVAPHWGAGIAFPDSGVIVLPALSSGRVSVRDLGPVVRHELAHVELQRYLAGLRIPSWFTEGYAVWSAGQLDPDADWYLRLSFVTGRAPSLDSLDLGWPARQMDARIAYLLSASAVAYLYSFGSEAAFSEFLARWLETGSFEQSLRLTYRISSTQFERLWAAHVRSHYGWLLFVAQGVVIWAFITLLVLILIFVRRRRDRGRLADLRRTEPPDAPAFWIEGAEVADGADEVTSDAVQPGPGGLTEDPPSDRLAT
ncbi:MAG: hypothetical protein ABIV28_01465 [Longimicrobiales bacterium]